MSFIKNLGQQVGSGIGEGIGGGIAGMGMSMVDEALFGDKRRKNQIKQQQKLTDMGTAQAMGLQKSAHDLNLEMWDKTNYAAQMEQLKKAGLNPAMIYGVGGGEGATGTIGASGGSAGTASNEAQQKQADTGLMGMGLQMAKLKAETKAMEAGANKNQAEADAINDTTPTKVEGMKKDIEYTNARIKDVTQNINNKRIQAEGAELQNAFDRIRNEIKEATAGDEITSARYLNYKLDADVKSILQNYDIRKEQKQAILEAGRMSVLNMQADLLVKASQGTLNEAQAQKAITEAQNHVRGLDIKEADVAMKETVAHIMKTKPNVWNVAGNELERALNSLEKLGQPFDWALKQLGVDIFDNKYLEE